VTRVLVVDDEPQILRALRINLRVRGYEVDTAATGGQALETAGHHPPDLVILDLGLPDLDGVEVIGGLRGWTSAPIIVLSGRADSTDKVKALDAGADDYVTKPFEPSILAARLRAVLRRVARHDASPVLRVGELEIDRAGMEVRVAGEPVSLTPTEYRLLLELAEHSGVVRSRERLLEEVWGYVWAGDTRLVDMHVRRLRVKIGPDMIETVRGAGYKMVKG